MDLFQASLIAEKYVTILSPWCDKIQIAGSIRRKQPIVHDIDIVCIPKGCMGNNIYIRNINFIQFITSLKPFSGNAVSKYCRIKLPEGINLEIHMATPQNWGYIFAIRTGSSTYSHYVLADTWVRKGLHGKNGNLYDSSGLPINIPDEVTLFKLLGIPWIEPEKRYL